MVNVFVFASTVLFLLLAMIWGRDTLLNLFFKIIFTMFFVSGAFISLAQMGFVLNVK